MSKYDRQLFHNITSKAMQEIEGLRSKITGIVILIGQHHDESAELQFDEFSRRLDSLSSQITEFHEMDRFQKDLDSTKIKT